MCLDCLGLAGTRFVCARCARVARRCAGLMHAAAALALTVAGALPALVALDMPREQTSPKVFMIHQAIRYCDTRSLDFILSSMEMRGADEEIAAIGARYAAECDEVPAQTAGFFRRARRRLVRSEAR